MLFSDSKTLQHKVEVHVWTIISVTLCRLHRSRAIFLLRLTFKHKPQTFSRVCLRLERCVGRWKRECYISANVAAIFGVTVVF